MHTHTHTHCSNSFIFCTRELLNKIMLFLGGLQCKVQCVSAVLKWRTAVRIRNPENKGSKIKVRKFFFSRFSNCAAWLMQSAVATGLFLLSESVQIWVVMQLQLLWRNIQNNHTRTQQHQETTTHSGFFIYQKAYGRCGEPLVQGFFYIGFLLHSSRGEPGPNMSNLQWDNCNN